MILLIDNYDSFTYNLVQQLQALGAVVKVVRNDAVTIDEIRKLNPNAIVLSPGPGTPDEAGICLEVVKQLYADYPILGICLGHQAIAQAFGAKIVQAKEIIHGSCSTLNHDSEGLFNECSPATEVMRYHSLTVDLESMEGTPLQVHAEVSDGTIMAIKHRDFAIFGLQFHPESFATSEGNQMIRNFLNYLD